MTERTDTWVAAIIAILLVTAFAFMARTDTKPDVALLLAQSCVGEAGFLAWETGECAAIWSVYVKRSKLVPGRTLYETTRKYSAAVKRRRGHPRPWVLDLNRELERPRRWNPKESKWANMQGLWANTLDLAEEFLAGRVEDPYPRAVHYGGAMDKKKLNPRYFRPIATTGMKNIFYERR